MSTANKLTYLNGTKQAIKQAINEDFEVIDDNTTFREYADEISSNNAKYKDLIPKETTNATNTLDISNSAGLDKALVTQYGNTYQETTTGKNLFDKNNANIEQGGWISAVGRKGNGGDNKLFKLAIKPSTTYTIQKIAGNRFRVGTYQNDNIADNIKFNEFQQNDSGTSITITSTAIDTYLYVQYLAGDTNEQQLLNSIQVEENSSATSYEKYTGGNPAPNPDYPQDIHVVSGDNTIKVEGKNLWGEEEHGGIDESTGQDIYNANRWRTIGYINVTPNTSYTISSNASSNIWNIFYYYDINKTFIRSQAINGKEVSATTPSNCFYMRCVIGDTNTITTTQRQLEKGATATTYEAYKEQSYTINLEDIELCKIGDYKDRIYSLNGKWYLEKKIGKVVLDGSEEWNSETAYTGYYRYILLTLEALNTNNGLNNRFTQRISQAHGGYEYLFIQTNNGAIHIQLLQSRLSSSSIADFKTWLSNNNVTVYYVLATPTTTEITESNYPTLYNQLNNIKLFEGVNHITMTNESGLDVEFDIEYYKDWKLD